MTANASVQLIDFENFIAPEQSFDVVTFVASIHHQPLREALSKARQLLRPGGELAIVGLAANKTAADWVWNSLCAPVALVGSRLHREIRDVGVPVAEPHESLNEIRQVTDNVMPDAVLRRGLYYRYRLHWLNG